MRFRRHQTTCDARPLIRAPVSFRRANFAELAWLGDLGMMTFGETVNGWLVVASETLVALISRLRAYEYEGARKRPPRLEERLSWVSR